jgi:Flp pilus assembly protein TadG
MPVLALSNLGARAGALLRCWKAHDAGLAALEFAFIAPMMGVMFIGAVELSQAIIVDRRVTQIASSTADLVARAEQSIPQSDISDIMKAGSFIMSPYALNPLKIVLREYQSSTTSATNVKMSWQCTYNGTGGTLTCACTNSTVTVPANLVGTNDAVIVSIVTYDYKPLVFDYFMKRNWGGSVAGVYTLSETIYQKPRGQWPVLVPTSGTTCTAPTFP